MREAVSRAPPVRTESGGDTSIVLVLVVEPRASVDTVIESLDEHISEIITALAPRAVFFESEPS
jgi:hypothetical protein